MPNWCYNSITIQGKKDELDRFMEAITVPTPTEEDGMEQYDFTLLHPTPDDLKIKSVHYPSSAEWYANASPEMIQEREELELKYIANTAKYGVRCWYDWNCDNWGSKWAPKEIELELQDIPIGSGWSIHGTFETAWCPTSKLFVKISTLFPTLVFEVTYTGEADEYLGCEIFYNGNVYDHNIDPYSDDPGLPSELAKRLKDMNELWEKCHSGEADFSDFYQDRLDLMCDLRDFAEQEASKLFLDDHPNVYETI